VHQHDVDITHTATKPAINKTQSDNGLDKHTAAAIVRQASRYGHRTGWLANPEPPLNRMTVFGSRGLKRTAMTTIVPVLLGPWGVY
jgi:hypothetical protein